TFDSINMEWDKQPFGFSLLKKKNIDIIAVRKRKKQTYQQDLTQEDFYNTVYKLMYFYTDKIAYGFSLGAYSALYYTSLLNCRILSLAPRLSIHPRYGRKNYISKYEFKHNLSIGYNDSISHVIVYDPKNKIDNNFVTREVMESFPNAHLVKIPYG